MGCGCHDNENVRRKRIGNDLRFNWTILDGETPYDLEGKDLTLAVRSPFGAMPYGDLQIEGNVISFTLYGKDQKVNGLYTAILQENAGEIGMKTVDITDIVMLVPHTKDEGGEDRCSHLSIETIDLTSQMTAGIPGPKGVGIESVEQIQTSLEDSGENIVRVTMTDGTTSDFSVRNGAKGSDADVTRQNIETALNGSDGKNLSTNDYTDEDKDKLASVEEDAQENVIEVIEADGVELPIENKTVTIPAHKQSDWSQNDSSGKDYIKNRTHWEENGVVHKLHTKFLDMDASPTSGSTKPVTSGGVKEALSGYVTSAALATALTGKVGSETIHNIVELTQAEYDAIQTKRDDTMYITTDTTKVYIGSRIIKENVKANEQDIDFDSSDKLQFADRVYNSSTPDGMGYKILRKNKTFASQVTATNTIYEIRYPFAVGTITIPSGCVLLFNGGELTSGTLTGNGTRISGDAKLSCGFGGSFDVDKTKLSWFGTDKAAFEKAMDFCAITTGKTLDGENIVCSITGTVTFLERHNINLERLNILYTPTANGESLFVFDCETQYKAGNNYMKDCYFESTSTSFSSVHCLNFKQWYNTTKATFCRVTAKYFTGYVIVNQSYLQEAVFDTVKGSKVGGYISFNPDLNYGENKGSSNILYFLNCGIDNGIIGADIPYVIDLCNMMTVNFVNFVAQGSNYLAPNTKAIRLDEPNLLIGDVVLDTAWFEFYGADANYNKVDIGQAVNLTMKHRCPLHINVTGIGVYIKINTETQSDFDYVLDNLSITNPERTHIDFDYGGNTAELKSTLFAKVRALYDTGVCGKFSYHSQVNRSPLVVFENKLALNEDGISRYVEHSLMRTNVSTFGMKVVSVNGVNVLSFTAGDTAQNVILPYPYFLPTHKIVYVDIIFRIFTEIAVTSSNISTIVCKSAMFGTNNFKQGPKISPYTPVDGQAAGYTDGWKRISYVVHATDAASALKTFYLTMSNTRIEFAKISYKTMFSIDEEEVFLDNGNLVRRNSGADHFRLLGLDAYSRKVLFTEGIYNAIKDSDATYEIDGKTFKACNGGVDLVASSYRHSGTTSQRPNFGTDAWYKSFFAGWLYLDETLNKSIIWSGTAWVNMDGTAL